jgi:SpoVK/Ycf46/Vps4 family AAA+-type ATPase
MTKLKRKYDLDDDDEDYCYECDSHTSSPPPSPPPPPPPRTIRSIKKKKEPVNTPNPLKLYDKKIESIEQLLTLIRSGEEYSNLPIKKMSKIESELKELSELIGMPKLKKSILNQLLYYIQGLNTGGDDYLHTVIYGKPGQGKTTVAKILGRIFSKIGILKRNMFIMAQREDLIAGYLGQTAMKTRAMLEIANKGVLFIDEIYSLGDRESKDSFSKECIDTINVFLSEHKNEFMLIVAGYEKEIDECFFSQNQGLRRRFMWYHTIDDYTPKELGQIFLKKVKDNGWSTHSECSLTQIESIIEKNKEKFKNGGGDIENFLTMCKINHGVRVFTLPDTDKKILTKEDLESSIQEFNKKDEKKDDKPPPMMYI